MASFFQPRSRQVGSTDRAFEAGSRVGAGIAQGIGKTAQLGPDQIARAYLRNPNRGRIAARIAGMSRDQVKELDSVMDKDDPQAAIDYFDKTLGLDDQQARNLTMEFATMERFRQGKQKREGRPQQTEGQRSVVSAGTPEFEFTPETNTRQSTGQGGQARGGEGNTVTFELPGVEPQAELRPADTGSWLTSQVATAVANNPGMSEERLREVVGEKAQAAHDQGAQISPEEREKAFSQVSQALQAEDGNQLTALAESGPTSVEPQSVVPDNAFRAEQQKELLHLGRLDPEQDDYDTLLSQQQEKVNRTATGIFQRLQNDPEAQELVKQFQEGNEDWGALDRKIREYIGSEGEDGIGSGKVTATNLMRSLVGRALKTNNPQDATLRNLDENFVTGKDEDGNPLSFSAQAFLENRGNPAGERTSELTPGEVADEQVTENASQAGRRLLSRTQDPRMRGAAQAIANATTPDALKGPLEAISHNVKQTRQQTRNEMAARSRSGRPALPPQELSNVNQRAMEYTRMQMENPELAAQVFPESASRTADILLQQGKAREAQAVSRVSQVEADAQLQALLGSQYDAMYQMREGMVEEFKNNKLAELQAQGVENAALRAQTEAQVFENQLTRAQLRAVEEGGMAQNPNIEPIMDFVASALGDYDKLPPELQARVMDITNMLPGALQIQASVDSKGLFGWRGNQLDADVQTRGAPRNGSGGMTETGQSLADDYGL